MWRTTLCALAACLLLLLLGSTTSLVEAAPPTLWQDLALLDCSGAARLFPSHPVFSTGIDASLLTSAVSTFVPIFRDRMQCRCTAGQSQAAIDRAFLPDFGNVLAAIEGRADIGAALRSACDIAWSMDQLGRHFQSYQLPDTCTSALYHAGSPCNLQLPVTSFDVTLQASIQRCPNAAPGSMPSISIACSGNLCKDLLQPCSVNSECSGFGGCTLLTPTTQAQIQTAIASALDATGFMPAAEQGSCSTSTGAFTAANVGNKIFSALMKILGDKYVGATSNAAISQLGFCGISKFVPSLLRPLVDRFDFLTNIPGFSVGGPVDTVMLGLMDLIPADFQAPQDKPPSGLTNYRSCSGTMSNSGSPSYFHQSNCWCSSAMNGQKYCSWSYGSADNCYCYEPLPDPTGLDRFLATLSMPFSFFKPLVSSLEPRFSMVSPIAPAVFSQFPNPGFTAWAGTLDDGTSISTETRRSGRLWAPLQSDLPVPSTTGVTVFSMNCNSTISVMANQPLSFNGHLPALQPLYQAAFELVNQLQTCRLSKTAAATPLSLEQLYTRFNPLAPEFWLQAFATYADAFVPTPSHAAMPSPSSKLWPTPIQNNRLTVPNTCSAASYAANGQCSVQYTQLGKLFGATTDLTMQLNVQRCTDYPSALPSMSLQCTGADCASFLNTGSQIRTCQQDSDCGAGKRCQVIDVTSLDGLFASFGSPANSSKVAAAVCDSGVKNAQAAFNWFKRATAQPAVTFAPTATIFGLCTLDAQDKIVADTTGWSSSAMSSVSAVVPGAVPTPAVSCAPGLACESRGHWSRPCFNSTLTCQCSSCVVNSTTGNYDQFFTTAPSCNECDTICVARYGSAACGGGGTCFISNYVGQSGVCSPEYPALQFTTVTLTGLSALTLAKVDNRLASSGGASSDAVTPAPFAMTFSKPKSFWTAANVLLLRGEMAAAMQCQVERIVIDMAQFAGAPDTSATRSAQVPSRATSLAEESGSSTVAGTFAAGLPPASQLLGELVKQASNPNSPLRKSTIGGSTTGAVSTAAPNFNAAPGAAGSAASWVLAVVACALVLRGAEQL